MNAPIATCTHRVQHHHGQHSAYDKCCRCAECSSARSKWAKQRRMARSKSVPAGPVRDHVTNLIAAGMSPESVAELADLYPQTVRDLIDRPRHYVLTATATRLMRCTLGYTAIGTRRRVQALSAIGWRLSDMADEMGVSLTSLSETLRIESRAMMRYERMAKIARAYERMSNRCPNPSPVTLRIAARRGYAPPLAWDDDTIDDQRVQPQGIDDLQRRISRGELVDELLRQAAAGRSWSEACNRLGYERSSLARRLHRAGRYSEVRAAFGTGLAA